jgi:hypothetical protein
MDEDNASNWSVTNGVRLQLLETNLKLPGANQRPYESMNRCYQSGPTCKLNSP